EIDCFCDGPEPVWGLAFSPDGQSLVTARGGIDTGSPHVLPGRVDVWDVKARYKRCSLEEHSGPVFCVAFSPDGCPVASGGGGRAVSVGAVGSGERVQALRGPPGRVAGLAFSPDGRRLAAGGHDSAVHVWDAPPPGRPSPEPWPLRYTLRPSGRVNGLAFSP